MKIQWMKIVVVLIALTGFVFGSFYEVYADDEDHSGHRKEETNAKPAKPTNSVQLANVTAEIFKESAAVKPADPNQAAPCSNDKVLQGQLDASNKKLSELDAQIKALTAKLEGKDKSGDSEKSSRRRERGDKSSSRQYLASRAWKEIEGLLNDYGYDEGEIFDAEFFRENVNQDELDEDIERTLDGLVEGYVSEVIARHQNPLFVPDVRGRGKKDSNIYYDFEKQEARIERELRGLDVKMKRADANLRKAKEAKNSADIKKFDNELHVLHLKNSTLDSLQEKFEEAFENAQDYAPGGQFAPDFNGGSGIDMETMLMLSMMNGGNLSPEMIELLMGGGNQGRTAQGPKRGLGFGIKKTPFGLEFGMDAAGKDFGTGFSFQHNDFSKLYRDLPPGASPYMFDPSLGIGGGSGFDPSNPFWDPSSQYGYYGTPRF